MKQIDERVLITFLKIVQKNANVELAINQDMDYYKFNKYLSSLKRNGLVTDLLGKLELTERGVETIKQLENYLKYSNVEKMILPDYRYFIETINENEVYLP